MIPVSGVSAAGGRAYLLTPPAIGSWEDPNSVIQSISWDGTWLSVTMQNPAAGRDTPTTGGGYILPIRNLLGQIPSTTLGCEAIRHPFLRFDSATGVPNDCIVHATWTTSATIAGATNGLGVCVGGNGTGMRARRCTMTAVAGSPSFDATMRLAGLNTACSTTTFASTRGYAAVATDGAGAGLYASSFVDVTTTYAFTNATYLAVTFGWVTGAGVAGSVIKVRPTLVASDLYRIPGI